MLTAIIINAGMGGIHYALQLSGLEFCVSAAVEPNPTAAKILSENFPNSFVVNKLSKLNQVAWEECRANCVIVGSPMRVPQKYGDAVDEIGFETLNYLTEILQMVHNKPYYILLENDCSFSSHDQRHSLISTLSTLRYSIQEFLLSPSNFGIPYKRTRYYLVAKRMPLRLVGRAPEMLCVIPRGETMDWLGVETLSTRPAYFFLQSDVDPCFLVSEKTLCRQSHLFDIVHPMDRSVPALRRGYAGNKEAGGQVLSLADKHTVCKTLLEAQQMESESRGQALAPLQLRYLTPKEYANMLGYPKTFCLPSSITRRLVYELLVTSVHVDLVARLLTYAVQEPFHH